MADQLLTDKDLQQRWGLSARTLARMRGEGRLPYVQLRGSRVFRYRLVDVERFEENSYHPTVTVGLRGRRA